VEQEIIKVAIYGATGYTGAELLSLLKNHPKVKVSALTSQSYIGKRLRDVFPFFYGELGNLPLTEEPQEEYDVAFLCLPHEGSLELVPKLLEKGKKVIDLSGAYRLKDPSLYSYYYSFEHRYPELLEIAVYGLPEIYRDRIKSADLVANPGCYPTSVLLAIYPLLKEGVNIEKIVITSLSGVSGAGRKLTQHFHFPEMFGDFFAYSLEKHRHVPEMEGVIKDLCGVDVPVRFSPIVVPTARGMLSSLSIFCERVEPRELYLETYKGEPFVKIAFEPPHTKWVIGTNLCFVYPVWDHRVGCLQLVSVIDNLGKGASSQAIQNFNLMMGFEETIGLDFSPSFP
jgi:N-acetyl-gamma-glutamyl-phosphate reductase